jgi:hypothetical protein
VRRVETWDAPIRGAAPLWRTDRRGRGSVAPSPGRSPGRGWPTGRNHPIGKWWFNGGFDGV